MIIIRKRGVAASVAVLALAGGTGAALADSGSPSAPAASESAQAGTAARHHGKRLKIRAFRQLAWELGLTRQELRTQLRAGKSLAQIAAAQGKSVEQLKAPVLARARERLAHAVANGRITQAKADELLKKLDERLNELLNKTFRPATA